MGAPPGEGTTGGNIARQIALRAGLPVTTCGVTINRFCSSGLQTIALAAQRIIAGEGCAGHRGRRRRKHQLRAERGQQAHARGPVAEEHKPEIYWNMLQTAEQVAKRYNIPKLAQDEYGVRSQQRAFAAQQAGKFNDEIVPMTTVMGVVDKASGRLTRKEVTIDRDEGIRGDTTLEAVSGLRSALPGGVITAGNASQFSDGARGLVVMNGQLAEQRGIQPLGIFRGFAVAGCEPDEMGIGPVFAVPRLLQRAGLKVDDIGLWELNEAFACRCCTAATSWASPTNCSTSTAAPSPSAIPTA
jgi:acetyl-CoA C-acetyltransferase